MEGYSSSVFGNHFDKNFSDFNKYEGFETNINIFADDDEQLKKLNDIVEKRNQLTADINEHNNLRAKLTNDGGNNDPVFQQYNDFDLGSGLDINNPPTVKDAAKEDIDTMILQQNNTYILGMITVTTLLVSSFLFLRD